MRQLDNLFGARIKEFKKKFNETPSIDISFEGVGDGENRDTIYRVSMSCLDNYVSEIISSDEEWNKINKMFDELFEKTTETLRRLSLRQSRVRNMEIEMPRNYHRVGYVDVRDFVPSMASEPARFTTNWDGEIRDTGETPESAYARFCESLEEV